jgi:hypothetical protein
VTLYIDAAVYEPGDLLYIADGDGNVAACTIDTDGSLTEVSLDEALAGRYAKAKELRAKRDQRDKDSVVEAFMNGDIQVIADDGGDRD